MTARKDVVRGRSSARQDVHGVATDAAVEGVDLQQRAAGGAVPPLAARHQSPVEWLEADYDRPGAFREPIHREIYTPQNLFGIKSNHRCDCYCETGDGEIWLQADVAAKWQAS